jgi:hypothetical protein
MSLDIHRICKLSTFQKPAVQVNYAKHFLDNAGEARFGQFVKLEK